MLSPKWRAGGGGWAGGVVSQADVGQFVGLGGGQVFCVPGRYRAIFPGGGRGQADIHVG